MTCTEQFNGSHEDEQPQDTLPTALAYRDGKVLPQYVSSVARYRLNLPGYVNEEIMGELALDAWLQDLDVAEVQQSDQAQ